MVRILALLLSLWSGPALAQATFTTVISPVLGTSPLAVTIGASPYGVICVSGCAAGASPSSVIITNTPTVSLSTSTPFVNQGTNPWTVGGTVTATVTSPLATLVTSGTVTTTGSPTSVICVSGCSSGGASPSTVLASLTTSTPYVNINTIPTVTTSEVAGVLAVNVNNTVTTSLSTSAPFVNQGTNPWTITPSPSPMAVVQTSGFTNVTSPLATIATSAAVVVTQAAGTSPIAVTPVPSPMAVVITSQTFVTLTTSPTPVVNTSGATTVIMAAGTSPHAVTMANSPTGIVEQNGNAYPNRGNWWTASLSTSTTGNQVLKNAPAANKLYVTGIQCARSDTGGLMMTLAFNATLNNGTSFYMVVPPLSGSAQTNMTFQTPLQVAATTSLQFTPNISVAALLCNAEGYNNP